MKADPAIKTDLEADNEERLPGPSARSGRLPDELREERVPGLPQVQKDADADDVGTGPGSTLWFPLGRAVYAKLAQGSSWHLKLFCHLLNLRRRREFWTPAYDDGVYHLDCHFESLPPDTAVFDLDSLVEETGVPAWRLKEDIRILFNYGYLSFVMFEAETPLGADCMGGSVLECVGEWDSFEDDWPVRAVQLPLFENGFFKVPEELLYMPENDLVFLLAVLSRARYSSIPAKKWYKKKMYILRRGQFVISISELARELEMDRLKCNRFAHRFLQTGYLSRIPQRGDYLWAVNLMRR